MKLEDIEKKLYKLDGGQNKDLTFEKEQKQVVGPKIIKEEENNFRNTTEKKEVESVKENSVLKKENKEKSKNYFFKIIVVFLLLIIVGGISYFYFSLKLKPIENLSLDLILPENLFLNTPLNFEINILNPAEDIIKDAKLMIILPNDVRTLDKDEQIKFDLGDIKPNEVIKRDFSLIVLNSEFKTTKKIKAILDYSLGGRQRFQFFKEFSFFPYLQPVEITFKKPDYVFLGDEFEFLVSLNNLTENSYNDLNLELVLPKGYELINYDELEKIKGNTFLLKDLRANEKKNLKILGKINIETTTASLFNFGVILKNKFKEEEFILAKEGFALSLAKDDIGINLLVNNSSNYLAKDGDNLKYEINLKNNSPKPISDIILKVKFLSDVFDFASLKGDFLFDEKEKTITWLPNNNLSLRNFLPNKEIKIVFFIKLKNFDAEISKAKNLKALLEVSFDSPTIINPKTDKTFVKKTFETKIKGDLKSEQLVYYVKEGEAEGEGFLPLKVNETTIVNLVWRVSSQLTDFSNIKLKAYLKDGVELKEIVSFDGKKPVYNSRTKEISWQLDKILANSKSEAIFKLELKPYPKLVNNFMPIISELNFEGIDDFTKNKISSTFKALDSSLIEDLKDKPNLLKVVE